MASLDRRRQGRFRGRESSSMPLGLSLAPEADSEVLKTMKFERLCRGRVVVPVSSDRSYSCGEGPGPAVKKEWIRNQA